MSSRARERFCERVRNTRPCNVRTHECHRGGNVGKLAGRISVTVASSRFDREIHSRTPLFLPRAGFLGELDLMTFRNRENILKTRVYVVTNLVFEGEACAKAGGIPRDKDLERQSRLDIPIYFRAENALVCDRDAIKIFERSLKK